MKKLLVIAAAVVSGLAGSVAAVSSAAGSPAARAGTIAWSPCPDNDPILGPMLKGLECGTLEVPLNHRKPNGKKLTLELTRAKHTSPEDQYQGIALLNRGQWPGGIGRDLPTRFAKGTQGLPPEVGATYDWIGFDPRGVGASEPAIICDPDYVYPGYAHPDPVPRTAAEERAWLDKARAYARSCYAESGNALKFLNTKDTARDLDLIRRALGAKKINYIGYDWGTYLGSVYASMYPGRVRRMVLDSVERPSTVWYESNLVKNEAAEKRAKIWFAWMAKHDSTYHLGATQDEVEANYYKGRKMVRDAPIDGKIGPFEYHDVFEPVLYRDRLWHDRATILSAWVLREDPAGLKASFSTPGFPHQNRHAMTNAVQCRDNYWPRKWAQWHEDYSRQYDQGNKFMTWNNAWYNAPCAFWPVPSGKPQKIGDRRVNMLLVQPENDVAHSDRGAFEVHRLFPNSRLVYEPGGNTHSPSLSVYGNACLDTHVSNYLRDGTRPAARDGVDASCAANPDPEPPPS